MSKSDSEFEDTTFVDKKAVTKKPFSDDEDDSSDEDLLNKVNAKLKSLKSEYMDDDEEEEDEEFTSPIKRLQHNNDSKEILSDDKYDDDMQDIQSQLDKATINSHQSGYPTEDTSAFSVAFSAREKDASSENSSLAAKKPGFTSSFTNWLTGKPSNTSQQPPIKNGYGFQDEKGEIISYKLLLSRNEGNQACFNALDAKEQEQIQLGTNTLKTLFNEFQKNIESHGSDSNQSDYIDWDFWSLIINDYNDCVAKDPVKLYRELTNGIPSKLRGLLWQVMINSKSYGLEDIYTSIILEPSNHEKQIKKDLSRTRFVTDNSMSDKSDSLFNIIKAYSLFDSEVGYTQGMAFIAVPLLMNMNESEAFCLMTKLMKVYGLREFYLPDMPGLHLILYQFERLLEDMSPKLHLHLMRQGIKSSMYASQWFLTMFAYKFPLDIVIRIFDVILAEGIESSLKFAIALMMKNEDKLLQFNFDQLLEYLKDKLFEYYIIDDNTEEYAANPFTFGAGSANTNNVNNSANSYRVNELVQDAMKIKILPMTLKKYESEHEEIYKLEKEREEEIETLRTKNAQLTREIRKLEQSYAMLNKEHVEVANEMIQGKVNLANLEDENSDLKQEISQLEEKISELESEQANQLKEIEEMTSEEGKSGDMIEKLKAKEELDLDLEEEIRRTMERNLEVMEANRFLEEQLNNLDKQFKESKREYESVSIEHEELKKKWGIAKSFFSD
ncbi:GTPase-activating protein [Saccharomycopsis crataegensis]|uniref:GTPase-activating protein GYP5 n=1 Tax=Saccharomycopsis crataegensis TaxID=43959 RepID=A0AAV5QRE0_9ASCO|nr:GTPase-activating protein [Saccharomycopsis crataegensis]